MTLRLLSRHPPSFYRAAAQQCRFYALSRFPHRTTGFGRNSRGNNTQRRPQLDPVQDIPWASADHGEKPFRDHPQHWVQRIRPTSDSDTSLQHLLANNDELVVTRQFEMLNIFMGFEQSNRYVITNPHGESLGYIVEEPRGFLSMFARQLFRTHRPFRALVLDLKGSPILWIRRPFSWINSRMFVQRPDHTAGDSGAEPVLDSFAEVQQEWHLWRRRYNLFMRRYFSFDRSTNGTLNLSRYCRVDNTPLWECTSFRTKTDDLAPWLTTVYIRTHFRPCSAEIWWSTLPRELTPLGSNPQPAPDTGEAHFNQIARVDEGLWAWYFVVRDAQGEGIASVNRAFRGFGREIFTDTGQYHISFRAPEEQVYGPGQNGGQTLHKQSVVRNLSMDERALVLAMAINIDYDYFSRHSEGGHGFGFGWHSGE